MWWYIGCSFRLSCLRLYSYIMIHVVRAVGSAVMWPWCGSRVSMMPKSSWRFFAWLLNSFVNSRWKFRQHTSLAPLAPHLKLTAMKMMMSNARDATTSSWLATTLSLMIVVASMMMFSTTVVVSAFSSCSRHNNHQARLLLLTTNHPSTPHPMTLYSTIDDDDDDSNSSNELQALGNPLILSATRYHGATDKMISIDWKADRIIVTVDVSADEEYLSNQQRWTCKACIESTTLQFKESSEPCCFPGNINRRIIHSAREEVR